MRKTTPEEVDQLYEFTRRHYVEYYDVQTELVDHLASAMDASWEEEPEFSFEENLEREFRNFGIFGFSEVVEKKSRVLEKRYFRLIWREMRQQVRDIRIFASLVIIFSGILLLLAYGKPLLTASVAILYFAVFLFLMFASTQEIKRKKKKGEKTYLLEVFILNTGGYFSVSYIPFQVFYFSDLSYSQLWVQLLTAQVFSLLVFSAYVCFYLLPRKRDVILKDQYPELKF